MIDRVEVDETDLARLVAALDNEADGRELRRDLAENLRKAVEPAADAARSAILTMTARTVAVPALRTAVASGVRVHVRLSRPSVTVVAHRSAMPRGFKNAPKRLNSHKGWRHQVYGNPNRWVTQMGKPGWFDDTLTAAKPAAIRAADDALEAVAKRIDLKTRG